MNIFTLDIGSGTQDFLLFKQGENIRNCIKMILPSPTILKAKEIKKITARGGDIFLTGYTMGGGAITSAVINHIKSGLKVYSEERAALTFADDMKKIKEMGIELTEWSDLISREIRKITLRDLNVDFFSRALKELGENDSFGIMLIAAQDHGYSPYESNRVFRFRMFEKTLKRDGYVQSFLFSSDKVPKEFTRMKSIVDTAIDSDIELKKDIFLIDTVFAALSGCMLDVKEFPALVLNFGNSHTIGAVVEEDGLIHSLFEHHTGVMRKKGKEGIMKFIQQFLEGNISNEDVFNDFGHGAFYRDVVDIKDSVATGPNFHIASNKMRIANPAGDVMILGNLGMIKTYMEKFEGVKWEIKSKKDPL